MRDTFTNTINQSRLDSNARPKGPLQAVAFNRTLPNLHISLPETSEHSPSGQGHSGERIVNIVAKICTGQVLLANRVRSRKLPSLKQSLSSTVRARQSHAQPGGARTGFRLPSSSVEHRLQRPLVHPRLLAPGYNLRGSIGHSSSASGPPSDGVSRGRCRGRRLGIPLGSTLTRNPTRGTHATPDFPPEPPAFAYCFGQTLINAASRYAFFGKQPRGSG